MIDRYHLPETDLVNSPSHYQGTIECIDCIRAALGEEAFESYLRGTAIKYLYRAGKKTSSAVTEDFCKAQWYVNRLVAHYQNKK